MGMVQRGVRMVAAATLPAAALPEPVRLHAQRVPQVGSPSHTVPDPKFVSRCIVR